ncbi:hypothetical protein [Nonomuraea sp. NPDC002799]
MVLSATACTANGSAVSTTPAPVPAWQAVADRPPYVCEFIPEAEVAALTGYTGAYTAGPGSRRAASGSCAIMNDTQSILLTGYERSAPRAVFEKWRRNGADDGQARLPAELGTGSMGDYDVRGYAFRSGGAWFRCGNENSLITIYIKKNPARDQDRDLIQLMEIAERRFAEMFSCELGGAPPG